MPTPVPTWRKSFLAELAATSNVAASARAAGISLSRVYALRRSDPRFYRAWQEALCEGYDHLEMNLLHRLREGEIKPAGGARRGVRVFDNATALRLLVAHRETVSRQRAVVSNRNADLILAAIDAKIEKMRERRTLAIACAPGTNGPGANELGANELGGQQISGEQTGGERTGGERTGDGAQ